MFTIPELVSGNSTPNSINVEREMIVAAAIVNYVMPCAVIDRISRNDV